MVIISQDFPSKHIFYHILKKASLLQLGSCSYIIRFSALDAICELIIKCANAKEAKWKSWEEKKTKNLISSVTEKTLFKCFVFKHQDTQASKAFMCYETPETFNQISTS